MLTTYFLTYLIVKLDPCPSLCQIDPTGRWIWTWLSHCSCCLPYVLYKDYGSSYLPRLWQCTV